MKGLYKMLADMFGGILIVALCIAIFFLFVGYYVIIKGVIKSSEEERKTINLGHVLISSDKLVYSDEKRISRAILDENKLDEIDSNELFKEIGYPNYNYFIQIINSDTGKSWIIGEELKPQVVKVFPVAIKNGDEIQVGKLIVSLRGK
jgi:hypothetical protein